MSPAWKAAAKRLLPAPVLRLVQRARWQARLGVHRLRWLRSGRRGAGIGIWVFGDHRIAYRIASADMEVLGHSFDRDIFFAAVPHLQLAPDAVVLDVGAHIGTFSVFAAAKVPHGRVYALEASRDTFELLRTNVELSGRQNIQAEHLAMAGINGPITLHHDPEGNYGHSITKALAGTSETVEATTLGRYLDDRGITAIALAKFNCEGAEFPILLATPREVLQRCGTLIVLYHCDLADAPASVLIAHLGACDFDIRVTNETTDRGWIIATRRPPRA